VASFLVGLTGGLASGKSTVARWLAEAGFTVADADRLVAESYAPGGAGARLLAELMGAEVLDDNGAVDRARVAQRVFADPDLRRRLEQRIHPLVRRRFQEIAAAAPGVAVLEATLLVEARFAADFDLVVTVEAPEEVRLARAVERGLSPDQALARLAAQSDAIVRTMAADVILDNSGTLEELRRRVDELIAVTFEKIAAIRQKGPSEISLSFNKRTLRRAREEDLGRNGFWLGTLQRRAQLESFEPSQVQSYGERLQAITTDDVRQLAEAILRQDQYVQVVLQPERPTAAIE